MIVKTKSNRKISCREGRVSGKPRRLVGLLDRQCEEYACKHTPALGNRTNIRGAVIGRRRPA